MAIGDTVQAGLMRVDTTPLLQAQIRSSEQMGNAIAGLGRDIGSGIQKFMQNKKEGEAADMQIGALLQNMSPERQQEIQSGEGELGKSLSKFMSGELGNSKKKALLGSLMTINTADQLNREEAMAAERFKQQKEINDLNRLIAQGKIDDRLSNNALNESLAKFSMQPVQTPTPEFSALQQEYRPEQIPGTPEFIAMEESEPMGARPAIIAKTITEQPNFQRFVKQDSPAVAQLPDSFKPQGRRIQDAVESGELSNQAGMMAINKIYGQAIAQQKDAPSLKDILDIESKTQDIQFKNTEFEQKQDAISFKPKRNYLDLGLDAKGQPIRFGISGKYANETEVAKIKSEVLPNYSNMNAITNQLIKMGEDIEGDFIVNPSDKVLAESLKSSLQGLIREDILGPGTVNDSERAILNQVIENPVEFFNIKRGRRDKINSLKGLRKKAFNKLRTKFVGLGLDVTEFEQGENASKSNKPFNMQNQTDRGLNYDLIDLDQL